MCPFLKSNMKMRLSTSNVDKSSEEGGHGDFSASDDIRSECGKFDQLWVASGGASSIRGRGAAHCVVDCFYNSIDNIVDDLPRDLEVNELHHCR